MLDTEKLNRIYRDADSADRDIYSEMRSNVLLVAGDHYKKRSASRDTRRDNRLTFDTKLRITKNHIHKLHRRYVNSILMYSGDVRVAPQLDTEIQDRKDAELNDAVLEDQKRKLKFKKNRRRWASDFFTIGEVHVLVRWNPDGGELRGYEAKVDEFGEPMVTLGQDEMGNPVAEQVPDYDKPVYKGQFELKNLYGFNVFRDCNAKILDESKWLGYKELIDTKELKRRYRDNEDALKAINDASDTKDYIEFEPSTGSYNKTQGKTMMKTIYIRPGAVVDGEKYPRGYFYLFTQAGTLEEGELPFGVWPIASGTADEFTSNARGRSPIKQARPIQAELNRSNSQMALHQVTIGDDKVLYMNGTKLAPGALLPGVRGITYAGQQPTILPGRDGAQYLPYIDMNKKEIYDLLDVYNIEAAKDDAGGYDAFSLLYKEANQKQAMSLYSDRFSDFQQDLAWILLELAKHYLPDDCLIMAAGRKEMVNMEEFRKSTPLHYQIKVEPQDETILTKFGRQLTMQHILQYSGNNLQGEDIGMIIKNMPFANVKHQFRKLTIDEDSIENELLALERGENPDVIAEMNHDYAVKRLSMRIAEADFKYLSPEIQQMFHVKRQEHQQHIQAQIEAEKALKNEFIPADGPMVGADVYVEDPDKPDKAPKRARIPQRAIEWLIERLEQQGMTLEKLESMNGEALRQLASTMGQQGLMGQGQPPMPAMGGEAMPPGGMM